MKMDKDKVMPLNEAIKRFVTDGSHISLGGFTISRNPMAAVYEIIRRRIKSLHVYAHSNGQAVDELIGGGCVSKIEIAYGGNGKFAPTCIRFRKAVQENTITVEDYTNYQMTLRFLAGSMGVPYLPTKSALGTDIIQSWGFSKDLRKADKKLPNKKLVVQGNPFGNWGDTPKLVLVPAINPDVTILHVQTADRRGTCRMTGLTFADVEQAKAAKNLMITCEELVDTGALTESPHQNQIPFIHVDAVVHVPFGAYPTACYHWYDYDPVYLNDYARMAKDDRTYSEYLERFIYSVENHQAFIQKIGEDRLATIKANERTGYALNLSRRH